jgi:preprotein translocase subunit SecE
MPDLPKPMLPDFKLNPVIFLKEVKAELMKVVWPTRQEVIKLTIVVIAVSILFGLYIGGLDLVFTQLTNFLIKK